MEIRYNDESEEWELFDSDCPTVDGKRLPFYTADSLREAYLQAAQEGWR